MDQSLLKSEVLSNDKVKIVGETFAEDPYGIGLPRDLGHRPRQHLPQDDRGRHLEEDLEATIGVLRYCPQPPALGSVPGSSAAVTRPAAPEPLLPLSGSLRRPERDLPQADGAAADSIPVSW